MGRIISIKNMNKINSEEEVVKGKKSYAWLWLIVIAIVIVVVVVMWSGGSSIGFSGGGTYQAVFLTNDQVYFGKLSNATSQSPVLRDVYYLQITQGLQPIEEGSSPRTNLNLVKLGGELHGPTDEMIINRDHILFYEDLKADSQVVTAINQSKETAVTQ